jgi:hypothetical protein
MVEGRTIPLRAGCHWDGGLIKILLGDQKTERIVDLKNFVATSHYCPPWSAVALDDSPLLLRDTGSQNIYSLDWEEP